MGESLRNKRCPECGSERFYNEGLRYVAVTSGNQEFMREDSDLFCPRHVEQVLILSGVCFCKNRDWACAGCVLDSERTRIPVKLIWLMSEILQETVLGQEGRLSEGA
jgi:hypothetical protein